MSARMDRLEFYRQYGSKITEQGPDWRWRYVAANGHILAVSSEGYRRRIDAVRPAARVVRMLPGDLVQAVRRAASGKSVTLRSGRLRVVVTP